MRKFGLLANIAASLTLAGLTAACFADSPPLTYPDEPIQPIPHAKGLAPEKVALGLKLFTDPRLSRDDFVSCAFCHPLDRYGADGLQLSLGVDNGPTEVNTPTVFNAVFNVAQFWDGRAATLEDQIDGPLNHPNEMGSNWTEAVGKVNNDNDYARSFDEIYGGQATEAAIKDAIATFERALVTPDGPFDRHLKGDPEALTRRQVEGYGLFKSYGCPACHFGIGVGGTIFAKAGAFSETSSTRVSLSKSDFGRYNVTGKEADRFVFKVPGLRNVAETAPYFHDGSAATLEEAVAKMAFDQLGRDIPRPDVVKIVDFLTTLTGPPPTWLNE